MRYVQKRPNLLHRQRSMHKPLPRLAPVLTIAEHGDAAHGNGSLFFLGGCADFYQEIASIKHAHAQGHLADYLVNDEAAPPTRPIDFANRVSARLFTILRQQQHDFQRNATAQEIKAHNIALYLMAALADEIFILELDWPGRDAWLEVLLEHKLFKTRNAGSRFFSMAGELMQIQSRDPLYIDLAAVFLLAMVLGFKGRYRGKQGEPALQDIRLQLYKLVNQKSRPGGSSGPVALGERYAFLQAYQHTLQGSNDERLAPLSPWFALGGYAALGYLVLTIVVWLVLMHPVEQYFG